MHGGGGEHCFVCFGKPFMKVRVCTTLKRVNNFYLRCMRRTPFLRWILKVKNASYNSENTVYTGAKGDWDFWISDLVRNRDGTDI